MPPPTRRSPALLLVIAAIGGIALVGGAIGNAWAPWAAVLAPLRGEHVALPSAPPLTPVTDRVVVRWADDAAAAAEVARQAAAPDSGVTGSRLIAPRLQLVTTTPGRAAGIATALRARTGAVHAVTDTRIAIGAWPADGVTPPDDPWFGRYQRDLATIGIGGAWSRTTGVPGVTVAVLDTGLAAHADLPVRIASPFDAITGGVDPVDGHGHGTHVAGTIAAATDNGTGIAGIAPGITLMPVKVLDDSGGGYFSDLVRGLDWARTHGADVVSLSLGGTMTPDEAAIYAPAFQAALAAGITIVAASGNDGRDGVDDVYPAAYPGVLAVGSTGPGDRLSWFSNAGAGLFITAPGEGIVSLAPGGRYAVMSGTSMAAPHVAGVVGLLRSAAPGTAESSLEAALCAGAMDLGPAGRDPWFGCGRLDAARAMALLLGEVPPSPVPARSAASPGGSLFPLLSFVPATPAPLAQAPLAGATTTSTAAVTYDPANRCPQEPRTVTFTLPVSSLAPATSARLYVSVNGAPFTSRPMTATTTAAGTAWVATLGTAWVATLDTAADTPGATAGAIAYYAEATNAYDRTRATAAGADNTITLRTCGAAGATP